MIRPLDLQTLYMNLEKVGKEQAQSKEAQALAQAAQVQRLQKEHDEGQHAVTRTQATVGTDSDPKVQVDDRNSGAGTGSHPKQPQSRPGSEAETDQEREKKDSAWKDPELGRHVDLSG